MAVFDLATDKLVLYVVYDGVGGAGKATHLRRLCEFFSPVRRGDLSEVPGPDGRGILFRWLRLEGGTLAGHPVRCHLIALPSGAADPARRGALARLADAVVVVCPNDPSRADESARVIDEIGRARAGGAGDELPLVVNVNERDRAGALPPDDLAGRVCGGRPHAVSAGRADVGEGVRETIVLAMRLGLERLRRDVLGGGVDALRGHAPSADDVRAALLALAPRRAPPPAPPVAGAPAGAISSPPPSSPQPPGGPASSPPASLPLGDAPGDASAPAHEPAPVGARENARTVASSPPSAGGPPARAPAAVVTPPAEPALASAGRGGAASPSPGPAHAFDPGGGAEPAPPSPASAHAPDFGGGAEPASDEAPPPAALAPPPPEVPTVVPPPLVPTVRAPSPPSTTPPAQAAADHGEATDDDIRVSAEYRELSTWPPAELEAELAPEVFVAPPGGTAVAPNEPGILAPAIPRPPPPPVYAQSTGVPPDDAPSKGAPPGEEAGRDVPGARAPAASGIAFAIDDLSDIDKFWSFDLDGLLEQAEEALLSRAVPGEPGAGARADDALPSAPGASAGVAPVARASRTPAAPAAPPRPPPRATKPAKASPAAAVALAAMSSGASPPAPAPSAARGTDVGLASAPLAPPPPRVPETARPQGTAGRASTAGGPTSPPGAPGGAEAVAAGPSADAPRPHAGRDPGAGPPYGPDRGRPESPATTDEATRPAGVSFWSRLFGRKST